jgi:hypothetical protein
VHSCCQTRGEAESPTEAEAGEVCWADAAGGAGLIDYQRVVELGGRGSGLDEQLHERDLKHWRFEGPPGAELPSWRAAG